MKKDKVFETVLSSPEKINYIKEAKRLGYFVRIFFVSTNSPTINAARIAQRVIEGGHDVPIPKIISRYAKSINNCKELANIVDRLYVYDNSIDGSTAQLLFRFKDGVLEKRYIEQIPSWAEVFLKSKD